MSGIMSKYKELAKKDPLLGGEATLCDTYSSGFDVLDYMNAKYRNDGSLAKGFEAGKIIMLVGNSGTGKSTLGLQIGSNFIKNFENSNFFHIDFERAGSDERTYAVTSLTKEDIENDKYVRFDKEISTDSVYHQIFAIRDLKKEAKDELTYDTGLTDANGKPIIEYEPTIEFIDSLALMTKADLENKTEMAGQMDTTAAAKANASLFRRIVNPCSDANIIPIIINHITQKVDISAFAKKAASVNYLKQDESIPGGVTPVYVSSYLLKLVASGKFKENEGYGIKGFEVTIEVIKSRSAPAGSSCKLVFDQVNGFDNDLSNLLYLQNNKLLKGSPRAYFIEDYPDGKFTLKTFKSLKAKDKKFSEAFDNYMHKTLLSSLTRKTNKSSLEEENVNEEVNDTKVDVSKLKWDDEYECYYDKKTGNYYDEDGDLLEFEEE